MISAKVIGDLDRQLPGRALSSSHPEFDQALKVYNGMIDRKLAGSGNCAAARRPAAAG